MSSLLQFRGNIDRRGVGLEFYRTLPQHHQTGEPEDNPLFGKEAELVPCSICGKQHPRLYVAYRKPRGMFGCWVVFQWNGEEHVPDLSCPMAEFKIPRDATALDDETSNKRWHQ